LSHFFHEQTGDWGKLPVVAPDALEALMQYPWPGNLTELAGTVDHLFPQVTEGRITKAMLPAEMLEFSKTGVLTSGQASARPDDHRAKWLKSFLRAHLPKKDKSD
jgi:DNA-binding NtrC family response regulator